MIITFTQTFTKDIGVQNGTKEDVINAINEMYDSVGKTIFEKTKEYQHTTITEIDGEEVFIDWEEGLEKVSNQGRYIVLNGDELVED